MRWTLLRLLLRLRSAAPADRVVRWIPPDGRVFKRRL